MGRPPTASPKSVPVSFRLPPGVKAAAERAAKDDTRSLSSLVEKLLTGYLIEKGYLHPKAFGGGAPPRQRGTPKPTSDDVGNG